MFIFWQENNEIEKYASSVGRIISWLKSLDCKRSVTLILCLHFAISITSHFVD